MSRDRRNLFDAAEEIADPSECSPATAWFLGVFVAVILVAYGTNCYFTGHGWQPGLGRGTSSSADREVFGREATALGLVFIAAGLFVHFNWFWSRYQLLRPLHSIFRVVALLGLIVSLVWFVMLRCRIG